MFLIGALALCFLPFALMKKTDNSIAFVHSKSLELSFKQISKPEFLLRVNTNQDIDVDRFVKVLRMILLEQDIKLRYINAHRDLDTGNFFF